MHNMPYPIHSYSWTIESDRVFIKNMNRTCFLHQEIGIPKNILEYFGAQNLQRNEKRNVTLGYKSNTYRAYFEKTRSGKVRLMWDASFAHIIKEELPEWHYIYSTNESDIDTAPKVRLQKEDLYGIHFVVSFLRHQADILTQESFDSMINKQSRKAKKKSTEELAETAGKAVGLPAYRNVLTKQCEYDQDVIELAKRLAAGKCDLCGNTASFKNKDKDLYLETHHIARLSKGGEDTIENTVALCPNCHRKMLILKRSRDREKLLKTVSERPV
jgi:5-methylcytosine-specific restriction endonuclease McrA